MNVPELIDEARRLSDQLPALAFNVAKETHNRVVPRKESMALLSAAQNLNAVAQSLERLAAGVERPKVGE